MRKFKQAVLMFLLLPALSCGGSGTQKANSAGNSASHSFAPNSVGFIGCSLSINADSGYHTLGGSQLWPGDDSGYGDGSLVVWVDQLKSGETGTAYWSKFQTLLLRNPDPQAIWWELCPTSDAPNVSYEDTLLVLNEIKHLAPNAQVYVTGVPIYPTDGATCSINTDAGSLATMNLAAQLVSHGEAFPGPALTQLSLNELVADGCHANDAGKLIWGQVLADFFGK